MSLSLSADICFALSNLPPNVISGYCTARKVSVQIRSFSDPDFPAFKLNTERYQVERYQVSLRIQPNTGKYGPELSSDLLKKIPAFVCLVFKNENK